LRSRKLLASFIASCNKAGCTAVNRW